MKESRITQISELHPDLLAGFLATGQSDTIPIDLQLFIRQLQWAMEAFETERSLNRCALALQKRIAAEQKVKIPVTTCKARIYEALSFFHVDMNVPLKVWENVYADQFEKIAKFAALKGDIKSQVKEIHMKEIVEAFKSQVKATEHALECRRRAIEAADSDRTLGITILYGSEVTPELLGYENQDLKMIARKDREGAYTVIKSLPIEVSEKKRLLTEARINEAEMMEEMADD